MRSNAFSLTPAEQDLGWVIKYETKTGVMYRSTRGRIIEISKQDYQHRPVTWRVSEHHSDRITDDTEGLKKPKAIELAHTLMNA